MINFNPKVSIIIPAYNGSNYLKEAIDSALAQTYKNIEIIVINDGSKDDGATEAIAKSYGNKIRYYKKENGGVATALNLGIKKMTGEYFSWLSHDDLYYPEKLTEQIKVLAGVSDKHTILYSSCTLIDGEGNVTGSTNCFKDYPAHNFDCAYFAIFKGLMNGCTMLIHKDNFKKVGRFDPSLPTTQDYQLWYDMFKVFPVKFVNKDLVKSRIHGQQGSIINSNHVNEADDLWTRMITNIRIEDVSSYVINLNVFYQNIAQHLKESPLRRSYALACSLADKGGGLVSVIIPTYNRSYCIKAAMESVYSQTYENYELIIIDDGSTDDTEKLIKKYKNNKTIYIKQKNGGVSKARNIGIKNSTGGYIAFLDSDDHWSPDHLEVHVRTLNNNPKAIMSYNNYKAEGPDSVIDKHSFRSVSYPDILFISSSVITTPSVVVRSKTLNEVGLFDEAMHVCEDIDLWRRISRVGSIQEIDQVLTTISIRDNHYSPDDYLEKRYLFLKKAFNEDKDIEKITISRLLLEMWTVYFSVGANIKNIYHNVEEALKDFGFLRDYMVSKMSRGEFGFYLSDSAQGQNGVRRKGNFMVNGIKRYLMIALTQGFRLATRRAVGKTLSTLRSIPNRHIMHEEEKKKILFLSGKWSDRGGLNKMISVVSSFLVDDFDVTVCSLDISKPGDGYDLARGVKYIEYPSCELHNISGIIKGLGIDVFVGSNNCDIPYLNIYKELKGTNIKTVMWSHEFFTLPYSQQDLLNVAIHRKSIFKYPDAIVWPTDTSAKICRQYSNKVLVIGNCIGTSKDKQLIDISKNNSLDLISIGRFDSRQKGIGNLLLMFSELLKLHKESNLSIVGKYDLSLRYSEDNPETVRQLLKRLHIPQGRVKFTGELRNVNELLGKSFANVIVSKLEGFGLTILEAAELAIPSIAFSGGGPADIIENNVNGGIVEYGDYRAMAQMIYELYIDEGRYRAMRQGSLELAERYSEKVIKEKWLDLVSRLISGRKVGNSKRLSASDRKDYVTYGQVFNKKDVCIKKDDLRNSFIPYGIDMKIRHTGIIKVVLRKTYRVVRKCFLLGKNTLGSLKGKDGTQ